MWPSAVVLSSWLLMNKECLNNKKVLELGAGCGLSGLVAAKIISTENFNSTIILTDFNTKVLNNIKRNINLNSMGYIAKASMLDFYLQTGNNYEGGWISDCSHMEESVDFIIAADVICKPEDAKAAAKTIYDVLKPGGEAIIISAGSRHRFGIDTLQPECVSIGLKVTVHNVADLYNGKLLGESNNHEQKEDDNGIRLCSGYVDGMCLSMFCIQKQTKSSRK